MPNIPYVIGVIVRDNSNNYASGEQIKLINETTKEAIICNGVTNSFGQMVVDLANLPSGYTNGDYIQVQVIGASTPGTVLKMKTINYGNYAEISKFDIQYEV
jgi:hypothetical protein